ncbi:helix-turn-helix domain-containing protein [Pedobacter antarcticus]|uniref:helix-turn-helix domain-containing protein n=1 Tax=Pedobacter antarcticus TaxID=34086 RepID=UPI00088199B6|nr:helix-turn-helix transcriptional regulator [Pedobacter antarcticus]SDM83693.1 regulatory protein, luxR family [Pedobacter antarcticus]
MTVFNTDMHIVTFVFVIFEAMMLLIQLLIYLQRPFEKKRIYYITLLILFIIYNVCGGLFPDPKFGGISLTAQNILAWGSGIALACYLPYYFYKAYGLVSLRFHARYGVLLFLLAPFLIFFGIEYLMQGNIDRAVKHGVLIPCIYAIICVIVMYRSIKQEQGEDKKLGKEMYLSLIAIAPWVSMPILSYFRVSQLPEVLVMNGGFLVITGLFIWEAIQQTREDHIHLTTLLSTVGDDEVKQDLFLENCEAYRLSPREIEVAALIADGLKYKEVADRLFIQERTVTTHVQKMFLKTGARNKVELVNLLKGKS